MKCQVPFTGGGQGAYLKRPGGGTQVPRSHEKSGLALITGPEVTADTSTQDLDFQREKSLMCPGQLGLL